jgi:phosphoglycolate phosphatase
VIRIYTTVLFDLDGTLLDTLRDLCDSVNFALKHIGFPERTEKEIESFIGRGVGYLLTRALPPETDEEVGALCLDLFRNHYAANMYNKTRPYDGITELLTALKEKGIRTGVISNKADEAVKNLCGLFFPDMLSIVRGASPEYGRKPDPGLMLALIREIGASLEETLYVGDTEIDIETAGNAGVRFAGVAWGYRTKAFLIDRGADTVIDRPLELMSLL